MADPELYPPAPSLNEIDPAVLPPDVAAILEASLHRELVATEWNILFNNAAVLGPAHNPNNVLPLTAGMWRLDNSHMVDRNLWWPALTSIGSRVTDGVLARKAVGRLFINGDGLVVDHPPPLLEVVVLKRLTVRRPVLLAHHGGVPRVTFAQYYFEEMFEGTLSLEEFFYVCDV